MAAMATEIENIKKSWSTAAPRYIAPRSFEDIGKHGVMSVQLEPLASMDLKGDFEMALHIQLDAFRDIIRGLVIVDGKFHLPEAEPLLALVPVVGGDIHCRVLRAAERAAPGVLAGRGLELLSMGYYRLDEMDRLRTEATAISGDRGFREQFDDVEVLDSAICQADTDLLTLIELGATMRQYFASSLIPERDNWNDSERVSRMAETMYRLPLDQIVLFKCLVDGLEAAKLTGCGDQLEAALSTIVSSDDRSDDRRLFIHSGRIGEYAHRIMRRWEDREVKLDHGLPGTLRIGLSSI
jgi:hypothetical protein